jgi:competence protein ComEC
MIAGYVAGHHLPNLPVWILMMVATFALVFSFCLLNNPTKAQLHRYWSLPFLLGVFAASLLYYQQSRKFPELWETLPAREANLTIKVKRLYASNDTSLVKGIAEIIETEDHLNPLLGFPIYFSIHSDGHDIQRGQRLRSNGVLNHLPSKESLTIFEAYLAGQSVSLTLTRAQLREAPQNGNAFEVLISKLRRQAIATLGYKMEEYPEELSIYRGMMLGIKGELSYENKQLFLKTGTLHLFAISGLHVGIIAVTWAGIFFVLIITIQVSVALGLLLVYLYVEVTGASPSAVRAFAMTAFFWLGKSVVRQMPPFQALMASAVVVLLISPSQLFSAGFQLSYTVVTGILAWGIPLFQTLRERRYARITQKEQHLSLLSKIVNKTWEVFVGTFCISLSATLASAPLSILYFELLAPFAIALNMMLVPSASLVIVSGLFSLISGFLHIPALAAFFNHGPLVLILITENLLELAVRMPAAFVPLAWVWDGMGFLTVFLFLSSLLAGHALKFPKTWLFCFPVVFTLGMIFLNSLIRML